MPHNNIINTVQILLISIGLISAFDLRKLMNIPPITSIASLRVKTIAAHRMYCRYSVMVLILHSAVLQNILSASGSKICPNRDSTLNFRATYPSKKSVRPARIRIQTATSPSLKQKKTGAHSIRIKLRQFGIYLTIRIKML